jgi:hypothetical protein
MAKTNKLGLKFGGGAGLRGTAEEFAPMGADVKVEYGIAPTRRMAPIQARGYRAQSEAVREFTPIKRRVKPSDQG